MFNSSAFVAFATLTQLALSGVNAQSNYDHLKDIVPKRDVMYVGGQYQNVTVSGGPPHFCLYNSNKCRILRQMRRRWP